MLELSPKILAGSQPRVEFRNGANCTVSNFLTPLLGMPSKSGIVVNEHKALGISAVWAAVNIIAGSIASLPIEVYKRRGKGSKPDPRHPLNRVISLDPHPFYSAFNFFRSWVAHSLFGNGYARIIRDPKTQKVKHLEILQPSDVEPYVGSDGRLFYMLNRVRGGKAERIPLTPYEVLHLTGLSWDGVAGLNLAAVHNESLGSAIATTEYGAAFYGNGAHVSGVIETAGEMSPEALERLRRQWDNRYSGVSNVGRTAVLDAGMKFHQIGLTPEQAQLAPIRRLTVEEVCRLFNIPPHMVHHLDRATFNNIEVMATGFVVYTLRPIVKQIEQELNRKLLTEEEKESGAYFIRINLDGLLRGDTVARSAFYKTLFEVGALSPNDIREREHLNPRPGGDEYFTPLNFSGNQKTQDPGGAIPPGSETPNEENAEPQP
jgi:HK97 family phage portal protein